jgi:hypothetical protein
VDKLLTDPQLQLQSSSHLQHKNAEDVKKWVLTTSLGYANVQCALFDETPAFVQVSKLHRPPLRNFVIVAGTSAITRPVAGVVSILRFAFPGSQSNSIRLPVRRLCLPMLAGTA